MEILLVNDDGYKSEALNKLKEILKQFGNVTIVAPNDAMSGKSIALTIYEPFELLCHGDNVYSIKGTPADCVSFGLTSLNKKFDLVVSGINYGWNLTYDTMHSGTCGACIESLMYDTPAIALSMERNHDDMYKYVSLALNYIFDNELISNKYFLNVNFPSGHEVRGIKFTKLAKRKDKRYYENINNTIYPKRIISEEELNNDSDVYAVNNGYISICPMKENVFNEHVYIDIKNEKNL